MVKHTLDRLAIRRANGPLCRGERLAQGLENLGLSVDRYGRIAAKSSDGVFVPKVLAPGCPRFLRWTDFRSMPRKRCAEGMRVEVGQARRFEALPENAADRVGVFPEAAVETGRPEKAATVQRDAGCRKERIVRAEVFFSL